ncbi:MAG: CBS domain-containing protein [Myxococcales bacterium]
MHLCDLAPPRVFDSQSLADAIELLGSGRAGALPVVAKDEPDRLVGLVTRADALRALNDMTKAAAEPNREHPSTAATSVRPS